MWKVLKWILTTLWAASLGFAIYIFQNWISDKPLPNLSPFLIFLYHLKFIFIPILVFLGVLTPVAFQRDKLKNLRQKVWFYKSTRRLKPFDINPSRAWFDSFFIKRPAIDKIYEMLVSGQGVLLLGIPLLGKTRCAFETLRLLKGYHVLSLNPEKQNIADIKIPRSYMLFKPKLILFLDDIQRYIENLLPIPLHQQLLSQSRSVTLLATCRTGDEWAVVQKDKDFGSFVRQNLREAYIEELSKEEERILVLHFNREWNEGALNGTPGAIVFGLEEMQQRLRNGSVEAISLMRSLYILHLAGIQIYRRLLAEQVAERIYDLLSNRTTVEQAWQWLSEAGFLGIQGNIIIPTHAVYIEKSFLPDYEFGDQARDLLTLWQLALNNGIPIEIYSMALGWVIRREFRMAEIGFRKYLEFDPTSAVAHHNLGAMLGEQGKLGEAQEEFLQAIHFQPEDASAHYNLGWVQEQLGQPEQAEKAYRQAIHSNPTFADAFLNLGTLLGQQGKLSEAENYLRSALNNNPGDCTSHTNLALILKQQGRIEEALKELREAVRSAPSDAETHYNLGTFLGEAGEMDESEREFREAVRLAPNNADNHRGLAWLLYKKGRVKEAVNAYRDATRCNPKDAEAHYSLGVLLQEQGQIKEAEEEYREAIHYDSNHSEAHYNLATALQAQGTLKAAKAEYREAILCNPNHIKAQLNLGSILYNQEKLKKAEKVYREGISRNPDFASFHHNLALVLNRQSRFEEAEKEFREAIRCNPEHINAHKGLIKLLHEQGRVEEAEVITQNMDQLLRNP